MRVKRVICIVLSTVLLLSGVIFSFASNYTVDGCNWMSIINDNTSLADISMPGTHDSAATYVAFGIKARCQSKTIPEQLNCGARFLDIRLKADGKKLGLVHSFVACRKGSGFGAPKLYLEDVIGYCIDFLDNNPKECISLFVKEDSGSSDQFEKLLSGYIAQNPERWYTQNRMPSLGEVRGKLVLFNRFSGSDTILDDTTGGINFTNFPTHAKSEGSFQIMPLHTFEGKSVSIYTVQDRYNYAKKDKWKQGILPALQYNKQSGEFLLNFFSTAAGLSPEINAKYINGEALSYAFEANKCYGAVLFDFIDEELAARIYTCNASVNTGGAPAHSSPSTVPEAQNGLIKFLDKLWAFIIDKFS